MSHAVFTARTKDMEHNHERGPTILEEHDAEFWYDDGTLILVAQGARFRIYRTLLASHSVVFDDMLSFPQPTASACEDGGASCPVVTLSDSARDWRNVLRLIIPAKSTKYFSSVPLRPSFETISACVRLGNKYQMTELYEQAMDFLKSHFTSSYEQWKTNSNWLPFGFPPTSAITIVNLARLSGEDSILPTALWMCCRLDPSEILRGHTYSDGETESLTSDDLGLCFVGRAKLMQETVRTAIGTFAPIPVPSRCTSSLAAAGDPSACKELSQKILCVLHSYARSFNLPDPLVRASDLVFMRANVASLCAECRSAVKEAEQNEHRAAWKHLPSVFGLEIERWK